MGGRNRVGHKNAERCTVREKSFHQTIHFLVVFQQAEVTTGALSTQTCSLLNPNSSGASNIVYKLTVLG